MAGILLRAGAPCKSSVFLTKNYPAICAAVPSNIRTMFEMARTPPIAPSVVMQRSFATLCLHRSSALSSDGIHNLPLNQVFGRGSVFRAGQCVQVRGLAIRRGRGGPPDGGFGTRDDVMSTWAEIQHEQIGQEALTANVQNNDVDGALKRLKRKAIEDGVMKKWRDKQYHQKRAQARRFRKQLNVRRAERRTMRANLRMVYDSMKAEEEDKLLAQRIANREPDANFPSFLPFDENLDYPTEPTWPLPSPEPARRSV